MVRWWYLYPHKNDAKHLHIPFVANDCAIIRNEVEDCVAMVFVVVAACTATATSIVR